MKYYFIFNPGAQTGKSRMIIKHLRKLIRAANINYDFNYTTTLEDAYEFSLQANLSYKYDVIVAVGGDGTINRVINGFFDQMGLRLSKAKLAVIHTGTSPDFCKSYKIPSNPFAAFRTILKGRSKKIAIMKINSSSTLFQKNLDKTSYFCCCANIGLGASVAKLANSGMRQKFGDKIGTFLSILGSFAIHSSNDLTFSSTNQHFIIINNMNTFIGKTKFIASGLKIEHDILPHEKRFYILTLKNITKYNLVPILRKLYSSGNFTNSDLIEFRYAEKINIACKKSTLQIEYDGDPQDYLPCEISFAYDLLNIIIA